jgi:aconitate hydratase 2/2-methylisocitrate dehydratase
MTNIGHFRAAAKLLGGQRDIPVKLWVAPPTKMDQSELIKEGHYAAFGTAGARTEMPGCSLCMGNQAQVREGATVVSTSTRNFPNRLGKNTNVYLASAELAAIASKLGKHPHRGRVPRGDGHHQQGRASVYKYLNFDQIEEYAETAKDPPASSSTSCAGRTRGARDRSPPRWTAGAAPTWTWTSRSHWKGAIWA